MILHRCIIAASLCVLSLPGVCLVFFGVGWETGRRHGEVDRQLPCVPRLDVWRVGVEWVGGWGIRVCCSHVPVVWCWCSVRLFVVWACGCLWQVAISRGVCVLNSPRLPWNVRRWQSCSFAMRPADVWR